jgi:hypothetical protein
VFAIDGVAQAAALANALPDEALLVDARKWLRVERSRPVGDLDEGVVSASAHNATEGVVEHLANELACVVMGDSGGALQLLLSGELTVVVGVAAISAPEGEVVRKRVVVVGRDSEDLLAVGAFAAEVPIVIGRHADVEAHLVARPAEVLHALRESETAHDSSVSSSADSSGHGEYAPERRGPSAGMPKSSRAPGMFSWIPVRSPDLAIAA